MVYSEYFENAFQNIYQGKTGYLYECDTVNHAKQLTQISCAYVCTNDVLINRMTKIDDIYDYYMEQQKLGLFQIKPLKSITEKEMSFALNDLKTRSSSII